MQVVPAPTDKFLFSYTPPFPEFVLRWQLGFIEMKAPLSLAFLACVIDGKRSSLAA
jgi:hypothetical protein